MGAHPNISADRFPKQTPQLGRNVTVYFHYDLSKPISGRIIRDDGEHPGRTIIMLEDERVVLATECHYEFAGT